MKSTIPTARGTARRIAFAAIGIVALAVAGVAVAASSTPTSTVSATFAATTITDRSTQTCTGADGTYEITDATYSGTATSADPNLNGTIKLEVKSVLNTTKNLGWLRGEVQVDGSTAGADARGLLLAVNSGGQLQGLVLGNEASPGAKLVANVTASFASATGFATGSLGAGASTNTGVTFGGACDPATIKPPKVPHADDHQRGHDGHDGHDGHKGHHHGRNHR